MDHKLDIIVAVVTRRGLPFSAAAGFAVADAERKLIEKLRDDDEILDLLKTTRASRPGNEEVDIFGREFFFEALKSSDHFGYGWFEETITP